MPSLKKLIPFFQAAFDDIMLEETTPSQQQTALLLVQNYLRSNSSTLTYSDFIILGVYMIFFLYVYDTKKKTLDQMEELFEQKSLMSVCKAISNLTASDDEKEPSFVAKTLVKVLQSLLAEDVSTPLSQVTETALESLCGITFSSQCNLEKIIGNVKENLILVKTEEKNLLRVINELEKFAEKVEAAKPLILPGFNDLTFNFCALDEAMFEGKWIICYPNHTESLKWMNHVRFLIEKTFMAATEKLSENFRIWVLLSDTGNFRQLSGMTSPGNCVVFEKIGERVFNFEDQHFMAKASNRRQQFELRRKIVAGLKKVIENMK